MFPFNSCYALAAALAIPLQLRGRNVFMSYNFETNYYYPYFDNVQGLVPLPFKTIDDPEADLGTLAVAALQQQRKIKDSNPEMETINSNENSTATIGKLLRDNDELEVTTIKNKKSSNHRAKKPKRLSKKNNGKQKIDPKTRKARRVLDTFMSRKKFYSIVETKLRSYGVSGRDCLLRTICECAENPVNQHNGVLGDLVHIVFTPSTSRDENMSEDYYKAEQNGNIGNCNIYKACPINILNSVSIFVR